VNPDLSSLARHASALDAQRAERLAEVHERIGVASKRRRRSALGAAAVAAAVVVAVAAIATGVADQRGAEPVKNPDDAPARPLAYAVGDTIHYGDRSIDVGEEVQFLTVTDDGVAFVRETISRQPSDKPLWFTDGSTVEQIGTTSGSSTRGYSVKASDTGSLLVVRDSGDGGGRASFVVIDTSTGQIIHRDSASYGGTDVVVLSVHADAIYWLYPADSPCELTGDQARRDFLLPEITEIGGCLRYRSVIRYDVAADSLARWSWERYDEDLRSRPRTIVGPDRGTPQVPGTFAVDYRVIFDRVGTDLIARDYDGVRELTLSEAHTGEPIRLRVPSGATEATRFEFAQWLDDDRLVLFAYTSRVSEVPDEGDIFVCALSSGRCQLELQGQPGARYQLPALD